jgi:hypothetical protein
MEGDTLSGKEFNRVFKGKVFTKLTNEEEEHNGFKFRTGLNEDTVPFNPNGWCSPGGIYFCEYGEMPKWLHYGTNGNMMMYCRNVNIPNDSMVYIERGKYKANKVILGKRVKINEKAYIAAVKYHDLLLRYVKDQTENICIAAVEYNSSEFEYVKNQTEKICMAAVQWNGLALKYVRNQTENICMAAVQQNGLALKYVRNQTEKICIEAVQQNGLALKYVRNQTDEICIEAVKQEPSAYIYAKNQAKTTCITDVLKYIFIVLMILVCYVIYFNKYKIY